MSEKKLIRAYGAMISSAMIWGLSYSALKICVSSLPVFLLLSVRFILAVLVLIIFFHSYLPRLTWAKMRAGLTVGTFLIAGFALFTVGMQYTDASRSGFIVALQVVMVPIINALLHKKFPDRPVMIGVVFATFGLALMSLQSMDFQYGDLIILASGFFFAAQLVATGKYAADVESPLLVIIQLLLGAIVFTLISLFCEQIPASIDMKTILNILYLGIFSSALALLLQTRAQALIPSNHAAIVYTSEPVFGAFFAILLLGETMEIREIIGAVMIVGSMLTVELGSRLFRKSERQ